MGGHVAAVQNIGSATFGILRAVQVSLYRKDFVKLERVQKRFTRMLPGFEGMSYRERLKRLELYSLECKRLGLVPVCNELPEEVVK
eukprot:g28688.t1